MSNSSDSLIKNRWIILFNVVLMTFMSCLDSSIVNVALPVMANKLGYPVFSYVSGREDVFVFRMTYVYITAASICALGAV